MYEHLKTMDWGTGHVNTRYGWDWNLLPPTGCKLRIDGPSPAILSSLS